MHPDLSLSLLVGALVTLTFIGLALHNVRTTPAGTRARVLTATATLMASLLALDGR
ncbi:hypothetical protein GCM10027612_87800 [Microbispora bryophytorum subsp. camponoti]